MNNFTPRAGQVLALSRKEAEYLHHEYVGNGHLLLGLVRLGQGVAVEILNAVGLDLPTTRLEVEKQIGNGKAKTPAIGIPYAPRVKKIIALAGEEARKFGHNCVGTEHILLGLLRDSEGVAGNILKARGVDIETTRRKVYDAFKNDLATAARPKPPGLFKPVRKNQRLPILIMSSIVCFVISVAAYFEFVRH